MFIVITNKERVGVISATKHTCYTHGNYNRTYMGMDTESTKLAYGLSHLTLPIVLKTLSSKAFVNFHNIEADYCQVLLTLYQTPPT
jgi:hypothetical protein